MKSIDRILRRIRNRFHPPPPLVCESYDVASNSKCRLVDGHLDYHESGSSRLFVSWPPRTSSPAPSRPLSKGEYQRRRRG